MDAPAAEHTEFVEPAHEFMAEETPTGEASEEPARPADWMVETALPDMDSLPPDFDLDLPEVDVHQEERGQQAGESEWMLETGTPESFESHAVDEKSWTPGSDDEPSWMAAAAATAGAAAMAMGSRDEPAEESDSEAEWMVETAIPDMSTLDELRLQETPAFEAEAVEPIPADQEMTEESSLTEMASAEMVYEGSAAPEVMDAPVEDISQGMLTRAQESLSSGNLQEALAGYNKLIRGKKHLDRIIPDLEGAVYRYPVDTNVLETLADAYAGSNRLQDALDAYSKAEELLR
jgi:hypothetical protein